MSVVVIDDDLFLEHSSPGHPERPERLLAIRAAIAAAQLDELRFQHAQDADDRALARVHSGEHIAAVIAMSDGGGGWFDADTYCTKTSAAAARRAAGAAIGAVDHAVGGTHSFALTRPPGHHATADAAMGFCLFNNAAVAVRHAQQEHKVGRIAVVDIDVHHGNGTEAIFVADRDVFYMSIHEFPFYPGTGAASHRGIGAGLGTTLNVPLPAGTSANAWLEAFDGEIMPALHSFMPELVLVSAGFDAAAADPLADLNVDTATYASVAARLAGLPGYCATAWCLEGGYDLEALGDGVVAVLRGLLAAPQRAKH